jgi:ectoine hydroxylase-related dioxygenase (phytanoyl-CoA dioxygenase family)
VTEDEGQLDLRKVQPVNDLSAAVAAASTDERLLGPMRQLMGAEPVLMEEKLNYKQMADIPQFLAAIPLRHGDSRFFLHHDWGYYRSQGYPPETLSSVVTIDETREDNGPIRVIPGTHLSDWPLRDPDPAHGNGIVVDGLFDPSDRVAITGAPGSVFLFHSKLLHDSMPNRSGAPRRLMIYSHYPDVLPMEHDIRNRAGRERGRRFEADYAARKACGAYVDRVHHARWA